VLRLEKFTPGADGYAMYEIIWRAEIPLAMLRPSLVPHHGVAETPAPAERHPRAVRVK
jgi:hypothetical protein